MFKFNTKQFKVVQSQFPVALLVILASADYFLSQHQSIAFFVYAAVLFLSLLPIKYFLSLKTITALFLIVGLYLFWGLFQPLQIGILLKYLLIVVIVFNSTFNRRKFPIYSASVVTWPWIILVTIGTVQAFILEFIPNVNLLGHARPIGLSVEPTFYSQQLLILWMLYMFFEERKKPFHIIIEALTIAIIILCATRTTIVFLPFLLLLRTAQSNLPKTILIPICFSGLSLAIYYMSKLNHFYFYSKLKNLFDVSGEPREKAFFEMIKLIGESPFIGHGFTSAMSETGLALGSLYSNILIAHYYTMGLFAISFYILLFYSVIGHNSLKGKLVLSVMILFSMVMPFLYTSFGLLSWVMAKNFFSTRKPQK